MDCGPAALKCILNGFGINASYGRLREACHTDVDGTSIDALEDIAKTLGLEAEQIMLPADHLLTEANLPCVVVIQQPGGATHFVVLWRLLGEWVQLMDPAVGRRWIRKSAFLQQIYQHSQTVGADDWRDWAATEEFQHSLSVRLLEVGLSQSDVDRLRGKALDDGDWNGIGNLDAALRMVATLIRCGAFNGRNQALRLLEELTEDPAAIPPQFWMVAEGAEAGELFLRGAVLLRVKGKSVEGSAKQLSTELAAALSEQPEQPFAYFWKSMIADGVVTPVVLLATVLLAALTTSWEAVVFTSALRMTTAIPSGIGLTVAMATGLLLLEIPICAYLLRLGRRLEIQLRCEFLRKLPLLNDRYFQSRLASDMAQRIHSSEQLREAPELGGQLLRCWFELLFTVFALCWFFPLTNFWAVTGAVLSLLIPLVGQRWMREPDFRWRCHNAALGRFYFDALQGLAAIRAHGAQVIVKREHENVMDEWRSTGLALQHSAAMFEGLQLFSGFLCAGLLVHAAMGNPTNTSNLILLLYWALRIPALARESAATIWRYPALCNTLLRLQEPLQAPEEQRDTTDWRLRAEHICNKSKCAGIEFKNVAVSIAGHSVLNEINLAIHAGEHVCVVGPSGSGKSSLVGLLLGWRQPTSGSVLLDGQTLTPALIDQLRAESVWVDPQVQIWNSSLESNLKYGAEQSAGARLPDSIRLAQLDQMMDSLPEGMNTELGEGGSLLSGGEGQRVRLARGLGKDPIRLVILDEPARGLESANRAQMIREARQHWKQATLICITHDLPVAREFDRVVVMAEGSIREQGRPDILYGQPGSAYREHCDASDLVQRSLWQSHLWRRWRIEDGSLVETRRESA